MVLLAEYDPLLDQFMAKTGYLVYRQRVACWAGGVRDRARTGTGTRTGMVPGRVHVGTVPGPV